ncbi:alpha/beta hydrolase [Anianabacter salinae]|uniref:alpha/beta hydrolase n=1 Tax=Anianabacter salinae TaxID=2851023 RepID=UPI00225E1BD2|nr:alpha/beta hydrolase [Anianabacter salinae]MBV0913065.1 alpha/beta hydrolase [Anianabacter salinae]
MDLTDAYENGAYIPGSADYPPRWEAQAQAFRKALGALFETLDYGPGPRHAMDLFHPTGRAEGVVVFIHGGYWRRFDRAQWSHLAAGVVARGWAVAMPSYTLAPDARIAAITSEMAEAVTAAALRIPGRIVVTGHSAGGHLAARMRCEDVTLPDDVAARLKRIVPISPLSDLRPLMQTEMNADLRLDADEARRESPALHTDLRDVPTTVWVGGAERPAFLDQARWLGDAWPRTKVVIRDGKHHFDIIEEMEAPDGALTEALVGGL